MIQKFKIQTTKSARYFQIGKINSKTKNIWIVLHGYGMLPEYFIKKFQCIYNKETVIIAPEALNKFYLKDDYSRVGSNWMTKLERDEDIRDNINFLNSIYESIKLDGHDINLNILGFSQGGPTATRWIINNKFKLNSLVLWGCDVPNDCLTDNFKSRWNDFRLRFVFGNKDEYINEGKVKKEKEKLNNYGLDYEFYSYDGGHSIDEAVLIKLI
ncbi:MAG: alpha/beta hydrolase [Flavobacteriaceae bacterium]|nr:alpha/beta hydrolase [Flavobacteriaceae bacterium]